jgi:hypothetical protein
MNKLFEHKWFVRGRALVATIMVALVAILFLNNVVQIEAQGRTGDSETIYRGSVTVNGRLLTFGPVMVGPGGSLGVYNSDGDMVSGLDAYGNITATGRITAAGVNSDDLVRGFDDTQARLVGSLAAVTTTITGTAVVATGPFDLMSGTCSLTIVPTTTVSYCALNETVGGNLEVIVYTAADAVATVPATLTWFAWVEDVVD